MYQPEKLKSNAPLVWSPGRGVDVWEMFCACASGDINGVQRLLQSDPALVRSQYAYRTPLYFAVRENQLAVVQLLLSRGADALSLAVNDSLLDICQDRGYADMQRLLMGHYSNKLNASRRGEAVAAAIRAHNLAEVRCLLDDSPELLHVGDERSNQPIHWAVMTRQLDIIDELLARGADIEAVRFDGARPIHLNHGDYHLRCGRGRYLVRGKGSAHPSIDKTIQLRPTSAFSEPGSITKEVVMSNYSDPAHTDRPNLEQKRKLAKDLLKAVKRLDGSNAARFTWNHPRFRGKTGQDVIREGVSLVEAQYVIARESGFDSWPKLKEYVRLLEVEPDGPVAAFEDAVHATIRGDAKRLQALLQARPEIAAMRSARQHRCVLPHYIAANGVETEHQVVPANATEIARILFAAGATVVVDATADIYGGGPSSTPLVALVSSSHPHEAGVQAELVQIFCEAGAAVNGIDDDGLPVSVALGFRYPKAASALAASGARIDNLPTAAGIGRLDLVEAYLDESSQVVSHACRFPNPKHHGFPRSVAPHPSATLQQALVFACMSGHVAVAKLLLDHGVEANGGPRRGITALHEACYQGQAEAAHLLMQHGADPTIRDEMWDSTAIGWADGGKQSALIEWLFELSSVDILDAVELRRYGIVRRLLEADPSLANAPNGKGGALRFAAFKGDMRMAELLLEFDADPTLPNENGHSALDYATKSKHHEIARLLTAAIQRKRGG